MSRQISFDIDKMNLAEEFERHAGDIAHVAATLAEAKGKVYSLSSKLRYKKFELEREVRADPAEHGIEKVTEAAISAAVSSSEAIRKIESQLATAMFDESSAFGDLEALRAKTTMLEALAKTHNTLWFSDPSSGTGAGRRAKKSRLDDEE